MGRQLGCAGVRHLGVAYGPHSNYYAALCPVMYNKESYIQESVQVYTLNIEF